MVLLPTRPVVTLPEGLLGPVPMRRWGMTTPSPVPDSDPDRPELRLGPNHSREPSVPAIAQLQAVAAEAHHTEAVGVFAASPSPFDWLAFGITAGS